MALFELNLSSTPSRAYLQHFELHLHFELAIGILRWHFELALRARGRERSLMEVVEIERRIRGERVCVCVGD